MIAIGKPIPTLQTQVYELNDNLDRVYNKLMDFRAGGGGDRPEHVKRALHDAVHKMNWAGGKNTLRLVSSSETVHLTWVTRTTWII